MANSIPGVSNLVLPTDLTAVGQSAATSVSAPRRVDAQVPRASEADQSAGGTDRTNFSDAVRILSRALQTAASIPPVRPQVVNQLKAAIASGNYQPDGSQVSGAVANALRQPS